MSAFGLRWVRLTTRPVGLPSAQKAPSTPTQLQLSGSPVSGGGPGGALLPPPQPRNAAPSPAATIEAILGRARKENTSRRYPEARALDRAFTRRSLAHPGGAGY